MISNMEQTILRTKFSGIKLDKYLIYLSIIGILLIDIKPFINGFIEKDFGWRAIFITTLIIMTIIFICNLKYVRFTYSIHLNTNVD